ncbi:hypothetical protein NZK32_11865 [Cyanobium sp. FGCU-52]|nr:hypothetical protein [Cyanobium sp. FGCU52]
MPHPRSPLHAVVFGSAALVSLAVLAAPARALEPKEMIETAKVACLESAGKNGWQTEVAEVISARTLDSDRVEVIFNLTRDGSSKARLTCPYSISKGVMGTLGEAAAGVLEPIAPPDLSVPVDRTRAWWLLLPIGLGLLSWGALRAREGDAALAAGGSGGGVVRGVADGQWLAEAAARDGLLEVREHADGASAVLHRVRNGDSVSLTGVRRGDWLEVSQGGWVREIEVRYDSGRVVFR